MGDDPGAARFALALGSDGEAYFTAVAADVCSDKRVALQLSHEDGQVIFEGAVSFGERFKFMLEEVGYDDIKAHPGPVWRI